MLAKRCHTCGNYYAGFECPYCRKHEDPEVVAKREEQKKQREEAERLEEKRIQEINQNYEEISNAFLMTTGNDFSGYKISEYLGIISEGSVQGTGWLSELSADFNDLLGTESNTFGSKMKQCRDAALEKAKKSAIMKGANALVSVEFETMTFRNNMIGIMVAGTAVRIERIKE